MWNRNRVAGLLLILVALGFAAGVAMLFEWRFESGSVYPPLSSMRADPLGAKLLYEALRTVGTLDVRRNVSPLEELRPDRAVVLFLNLDPRVLMGASNPDAEALAKLLERGSRVVAALAPVTGAHEPPAEGKEKEKQTVEQWGVHISAARTPGRTSEGGQPRHSLLYFDGLDPAWRVLARGANGAVLVERGFGAGSLVLDTEPYRFSNEALAWERDSATLSEILGPSRTVIFDEWHNGIRESPGVAGLARRYRLGPLAGALALLAILWIWMNAAPLAPEVRSARTETEMVGRDSASGFVNLLRRNIPEKALMETCVAEWRSAHPGGRGVSEERAALVREAAAGPGNSLEVHRRITQLLERNRPHA